MSKPTFTSSTGSAASEMHGVADPFAQQHAKADGGFHCAGAKTARLGDAQMQRLVDLLGQQAIGTDRQEDVGRLDAHLEVLEVEAIQVIHVAHGGLEQRFWVGSPYFSWRSRSRSRH
jgi:hypothetical protein